MSERLYRATRVMLDASGNASVTLGPGKYSERWKVSRISTRGNSAVNPTLRIYRGASGGDLIDYTKRGNSAISENNPPVTLIAGQTVTCDYSVGTSGAFMDLYLEGEIEYAVSG